jgi:hypothetical protein
VKFELSGLRLAKEKGITKVKATLGARKDLVGLFAVEDKYTRSKKSIVFDAGQHPATSSYLSFPDTLLDPALLDRFGSLFLFGTSDRYFILTHHTRARICIPNPSRLFASLTFELFQRK